MVGTQKEHEACLVNMVRGEMEGVYLPLGRVGEYHEGVGNVVDVGVK